MAYVSRKVTFPPTRIEIPNGHILSRLTPFRTPLPLRGTPLPIRNRHGKIIHQPPTPFFSSIEQAYNACLLAQHNQFAEAVQFFDEPGRGYLHSDPGQIRQAIMQKLETQGVKVGAPFLLHRQDFMYTVLVATICYHPDFTHYLTSSSSSKLPPCRP